MSKYTELIERSQTAQELRDEKEKLANKHIQKALEEKANMENDIYELREARENEIRIKANYRQYATQEMLSTALKGIYISALEECTVLTKQTYRLAESLVDNYIQQRGASNIMSSMKGRTYLLDTLYEDVKEAEKKAEDDADTTSKTLNSVSDQPKEDMMDQLDKEDDVQDAVRIISNRIADAEQEFIQKNAEDKERINNIVNDINNRIDSVKGDDTTPDDQKDEIANECAMLGKRKINAVYNDRPHTVYETMVHMLSNTILKNPKLKSQYMTEEGKLDMLKIMDTAKCMYGFLEFTNTIQLEKVDEAYIGNVLNELA